MNKLPSFDKIIRLIDKDINTAYSIGKAMIKVLAREIRNRN